MWHDFLHNVKDSLEFHLPCSWMVSHREDSYWLNVLLSEFLNHEIGQQVGLSPWRRLIKSCDIGIHSLTAFVVAHVAPEVGGVYWFASQSIIVLLEGSLGFCDLVHELRLGAYVVFVNIEEVMDSLAILLVELCAEAGENWFKLPDVYIFVIIDITGSKKLSVSNVSILENSEELEHSSMLVTDIVIRSISGVVLLSTLVVSFECIIELFTSNVTFHIFIKDEAQSWNLSFA
jgi:hypothetical protein